MYSLTKAGEIFLSGWIEVLQNYQKVLNAALDGMNPQSKAPGKDSAR
jgi:hypothetical protein